MIIPAADRLKSVSEYFFSQKLEQIRQMNAQGCDVINLGVGSPDRPPRPEVIRVASAALASENNHGYSSSRSTLALRSAIAAWYARVYHVALDPEREVLPLLGSKEGLFYISMAYLNPGDQALVPNPGYPAYTSATQLAGATPVGYDLKEENHWLPDFSQLKSMNLKKVKIMWVNYPHMPTGAEASQKVLAQLIEFCHAQQILLCHDNPYSLILNRNAPISILSADPKLETSLELNSFSKSFHMAGWRIGMLLASGTVIDTVLRVKSNVDSGMFLPLQLGAVEALNTGEVWHQDQSEIYRKRQVWAGKIFAKLNLTWGPEQSGLFLWGKAPPTMPNVEAALDEILIKARVFLTPGFIFGTQGRDYIRCSICAPVTRLKEALARMEEAL